MLYRFQCSPEPATASQMRRDFCSAKYLVPAAQALTRNMDPHSKTVLSSVGVLTLICKSFSSSQSPPRISALYVCAAFCFGPLASFQCALQNPAARCPAPEALAVVLPLGRSNSSAVISPAVVNSDRESGSVPGTGHPATDENKRNTAFKECTCKCGKTDEKRARQTVHNVSNGDSCEEEKQGGG